MHVIKKIGSQFKTIVLSFFILLLCLLCTTIGLAIGIIQDDFSEDSPYPSGASTYSGGADENSEVMGTSAEDSKNASTELNDSGSILPDETDQTLYHVTGVVDGDTIKIDVNGTTETVRLIGVDSPETKDPRKPVQCFGVESSNHMKDLVEGKSVRIAFDDTQAERDKYGRLLLYIWVDDIFVNESQIAEGYAYEYTYDTPYQYQAEFRKAEEAAKNGEFGLWGDPCNGGDGQVE